MHFIPTPYSAILAVVVTLMIARVVRVISVYIQALLWLMKEGVSAVYDSGTYSYNPARHAVVVIGVRGMESKVRVVVDHSFLGLHQAVKMKLINMLHQRLIVDPVKHLYSYGVIDPNEGSTTHMPSPAPKGISGAMDTLAGPIEKRWLKKLGY